MTYNDPKLFEEILKLREHGVSKKTIASFVGIDRKTLYRWLKWGENKRSKYRKFKMAFDKATAKAVINHHQQYEQKCITSRDHLELLKILEPKYYVTEKRVKAMLEVNENQQADVKDVMESIKKDFADLREEKLGEDKKKIELSGEVVVKNGDDK